MSYRSIGELCEELLQKSRRRSLGRREVSFPAAFQGEGECP